MTDELPDTPAASRACHHCGAGLVDEQDWCLECGTAAPGRLGTRPGWKSAGAVVALTLALSGGTVAAAYAAISSDANDSATAASLGSGAPVAQAPAAIPGPTPTGPTGPTGTTATGTTSVVGTTGPSGASGPSGIAPVKPVKTPTVPSVPAVTPAPTPAPTPTATPTTTPSTTTQATAPPVDPGPKAIALEPSAASLYNPFLTKVDTSDPSDPKATLDDDAETTWYVSTSREQADGPDGMRVGLVIDLGSKQRVRRITYTTATPGHTVEIYGTTRASTPPDIDDARWKQIGKRGSVDESSKAKNTEGDGEETIRVDDGEYRKVVLWFTKPSTEGPVVGITDVELAG